MLASTIQFTTNPPTPTPHHPHKAAQHGSGNQGALPQNPDSMPPPHHAGAPTTTQTGSSGRVSYTKHQATNPTREKQASRDTVSHPAFRESKHPRPAQTHSTA